MTSNDDDYTTRVTLRGSAEVTLEALTTTDGLAAWWTDATGVGTRGGELRFTFGDESAAVTMRVDAAEPERVAWTCIGAHVSDWVGTTLSFEFTARADGGCNLTFCHHGLTPQLECYLDCKSGWDHFIPSLQAFVDTGVGYPCGSADDQARREARSQRPAAVGSIE